jgi:hypothetical protein
MQFVTGELKKLRDAITEKNKEIEGLRQKNFDLET